MTTTETLIQPSMSESESSLNQAFSGETDLLGDFPIQSLGFDSSSYPNSDSEYRILIV